MAKWEQIATDQPEFAAAVRERLDAGKHKTIATLRRDGSPRISGTEADFVGADLWFGSMPGALKARDLQRDPRFALHSASEDPPGWSGDAKLAGTAVEIGPGEQFDAFVAAQASEGERSPAGSFHLSCAEITEVVLIGLSEARDRMVIEHWHEGRGLERIERE